MNLLKKVVGVPLLNFRGVQDPTFKLWGGPEVPGSCSHFYTMPQNKLTA